MISIQCGRYYDEDTPRGTYLSQEGSKKSFPEELLQEFTSNLRPIGHVGKRRKRAFQVEGTVFAKVWR